MTYLIYARVSPKGSSWDGNETSIPDQIAECRAYILARDPAAKITVIQDEFFTAATTRRPGYQQILADLDGGGGGWDCLVVRHLDRMSRSLVDAMPIIERLRDTGRGLISVMQQLDLSSPTGRAMLWIILVFAQWEREMLGERVKSKMVSIAAAGGWPVGNPPYGYRRSGQPHDNVLQVDGRRGAIVRDIYDRYGSGESLDAIHSTYRGAKGLSRSSIMNILRNPVYLGKIHYDGQTYPGRHPKLITPEQAEAVRERLPAPSKGRPNAQKYPYLLTGILYCECGRHLTARTAWNRSRQYPYYRCTDTACRKQYPAGKIEQAVIAAIKEAPLDRGTIEETVAQIRQDADQQRREAAPELTQTEAALRTCRDEIAKIENAFLTGLVDAENKTYWNEKLSSTRRELDTLTTRRAVLKERVESDLGHYQSAEAMARTLSQYADIIKANDTDPALTRNAILALIQRIDIEGDTLRITYQPQTGHGVHNSTKWLPMLVVCARV